MLGRVAVTRPDLMRRLRGESEIYFDELRPWFDYFLNSETENPKGQLGRFKQWFGLITKGYPKSLAAWQFLKSSKTPDQVIFYL